ncbi:hypothetical protein TrRE_jg5543 [Triparma retinervis]|uniref:Uncharacterized protein n=1 Tax=Triparma retinervis TaxID=2557542 RepID=A0A9W6ZME4_9STRA|nr:hypothetical protein TrRE_jg5543 [Triparma retinervis]
MAISRFLFTAVMVGLAWNLNMNAVAEARELGVYEPVVRGEEGIIRIGGKPMVFYAGDGDMEDEIHYNSEAHQHPWLATSISLFILLFLIFFIIRFAASMGEGEEERRRFLRMD